MDNAFTRFLIVSFLVVGLTGSSLAEPTAPSHDDSFTKAGLFKADVATLKDMQLVAHPDLPLKPNQNMLWCGTLQLTWNKAIDLVGEKLQFTTKSPIADLLNQESFTGADLDPGSYVAVADFERNNVEDEICAALEKTFHGAASPELIPPKPINPGPDDFVAYSYLYKNLAFEHPFEDNKAISFVTPASAGVSHLQTAATSVFNFGFLENRDKLSSAVLNQLSIYDYKSEDDFVLKLQTKSVDDELILAKITPGSTLQATIADVLKRISKGKPEYVTKLDQLAIPKLNFDLRKNFKELEGLKLQPGPDAKIKRPLIIAEAKQLVRFQLNEKGAILKSEAVMVMVGSAVSAEEPKTHTMIFDKPFLILMKQAKSDEPYFALWVGNASLLIPALKD